MRIVTNEVLVTQDDIDAWFEEYLLQQRACECGDCEMQVEWEGLEIEFKDGPIKRIEVRAGEDGGEVRWSCTQSTAMVSGPACPAVASFSPSGSAPTEVCAFSASGDPAFCFLTVRRGDLNGDGLDWDDYDVLADHVWGGEEADPLCPAALDVTGDGVVDDADVQILDEALLLGDLSTLGSVSCMPQPVADACPFAAHDDALACPEYFVRGDANADGNVDMADALATLDHLYQGGADVCYEAADVDGSGSIDLTDAVSLLGYLFQGGTAPVPPAGFVGPSCRISCAFDSSALACSP